MVEGSKGGKLGNLFLQHVSRLKILEREKIFTRSALPEQDIEFESWVLSDVRQ